ncbi:MAG: ribose-5-phosphate isomerase RpiA [Pseudomonadota bacterium]
MTESRDIAKKNAALRAAEFVENGMTLGLGTGSTAKHLIDALGEKIKDGWSLKGVPTSEQTREQAINAGVDIIDPDETTQIDIAIDGADEADPDHNLIKGGGGALLREKIVATAAQKFVVIADKSKRVAHLGAFPLPVEIDPFSWALTVRAVRDCLADFAFADPRLSLRMREGAQFISDGGNLILDCALNRIEEPSRLATVLNQIPGVVETGLFCGLVNVAVYGDEEGARVEYANRA